MFLGLDIGTSGVKAVIADDAGAIMSQATAPLSVSRPHPLWSEQDPADWWTATCEACHGLPAHHRRKVAAIGLSGQMHGATLLGVDDRPLRPAILWNDGRSQKECEELETAEPHSRAITGNLAMPGFTAPKVVWARKHEPDVFAGCKTVLLPKDYVRLLMTGEKISDMSDAAGTLWLDVGARAWSEAMLAATGLDASHMPLLVEGSQAGGALRAEAAVQLGLSAELPVAGGGGDNAASAVGMGVINPQDAFLSLGTSGVIFVCDDKFLPNPARAIHAFCHALPDRWHRMSVMLSAASALDWAVKASGFDNVRKAIDVAAQLTDLENVPVFLPYLTGERTPHNNPFASGVLFNLSPQTTPAHIVRSALEGVAFGLAQGFDALCEAGAAPEALTVVGGGARSEYWGHILAAALNVSLIYREASEVGAAYGAARLAMLCAGASDSDACVKPPLRKEILPDARIQEHLEPRKEIFEKLYGNLRPLFRTAKGT